jgi:hypothetical protein
MKSLLVVEAASHPKVLENQFFLFHSIYNMTFMTIPDKYSSYESMMPNILKHGKIKYSIHSTSLFIQLLFVAYKYDYIHISTGPEHQHFSNLWTRPFYFLCTFFYGQKTILTIKNSRAYLYKKSFLPDLLHKSLKHVNLIMFETATLKNFFVRSYSGELKTAVIYDRYTNLLSQDLLEKKVHAPPPYRIGLLGALDSGRRDYQTVLEALEGISKETLSSLEIILLGECEGGKDNPLLQTFQKLVKVDYPQRYLSSDEFDHKGSSCHLLISPLLESMEYGTFKGSGAIGDAIYLRKTIIMPSFVDPEKEFDQIAYYYSDRGSLFEILNSVNKFVNRNISDDFISEYDTSNIAQNVISQLQSDSSKIFND